MRTLRYTLAFALFAFLAIPAAAQTPRDSVAASRIRPDLDAILSHDRQYCKTKNPVAYKCRTLPIDTTRELHIRAVLDSLLRPPTPLPAPLPAPAPAPTPAPTPTPAPAPSPTPTPSGFVAPELPRAYVASALNNTPAAGRTLRVTADLQATLDSAQCGDRILLPASTMFSGNYVLRKACSAGAWILVMTEGCTTFPAEGVRVSPTAASCYAKLVAADASAPAIKTAPGASYYRLLGIELTLPANAFVNYGIVALGSSGPEQSTLAAVPHHIVLDRLYVHGVAGANVQRCVALNSASSAVIDSYISECHYKGVDAQAIVGWNGPGPFKIVNNYIEGSGENVMFGGADPSIPNLNPADIEIRRNHIRKPLEWKGVWSAKNLFELKNAVRVLFEGNVLENSWTDAQVGQAIVMQALSDNNSAAWTTVQDVTVRNSIIRNANIGAAIASRAAYGNNGQTALVVSQPSQRISFQNDLFEGIGSGNLFNASGDLQHFSVVHVTSDAATGSTILMFDDPQKGSYIADNVLGHSWWGIYGNLVGEGWPAITKYAPDLVMKGNVLYSRDGWPVWNPDLYPTANTFAGTPSSVGFANYPADLSLSAASPYKGKATDGKDPGVDFMALKAATAGVVP